MAQKRHASATEVTVAPLAEASGFEQIVQRYWKHGIVLFLAISGAIVGVQMMQGQAKDKVAADWASLARAVEFTGGRAIVTGEATELRELAQDKTRATAPWALLGAASKLEQEGDYDGALAALEQLEREHPNHLAVTRKMTIGEQNDSLVRQMRARVEGMRALKAGHPNFFDNPEPAADAPSVRISTSKGDIVVALYPEYAPKHVENFLKLAAEGAYDNTKFHRVMADFMIQGGDPNSIAGEPDTWGQGDVGYTIPQESSRLLHFPGFLAAAKKPNEAESSGCQFYITLGAPHHLDNQHTVYGKVVEGMDVVRAIGGGAIAAETVDRPSDPVTVTGMVKIE